jgi:predicted phosphodiesterase
MIRQMLLAICLVLAAPATWAELLTPAWVELGEGDAIIARVIIDAGECPGIEIDGNRNVMVSRTPVPAGFRPVCEARIPANTRTATVNGQRLPMPRRNPQSILVMGDTGCRIEGARVQACNDPAAWPFQTVAGLAAKENPDLVVHAGDYLYREDLCPPDSQSQCGGTTAGDNWETWSADFFAPAAQLLRAAPWALVRGNHENCQRSWRGWFYYLDPLPWQPNLCQEVSAPYTIQSVEPALVMFDSASVSNNPMKPEAIRPLTHALSTIGDQGGWLVVHHPIWGAFVNQAKNPLEGTNRNLEQAWKEATPRGIDVILSGHMHVFELLSYGDLPVQVVAGIGGTLLDSVRPQELSGIALGNVTVMTGAGRADFGYTLLTKQGADWNLTLKNVQSRALIRCTIHGRDATCPASAK